MSRSPPRDPWAFLSAHTPARIGLGRAGMALPTREVLGLALAHARARDAVLGRPDRDRLISAVAGLGLDVTAVDSQAVDRPTYLARPDLGRKLSADSVASLAARPQAPSDLAIIVADGLSSAAIDRHALPLLAEFLPHVRQLGLKLAPVTVAMGARVALGDDIASRLGAKCVAVLIGERPGLSSPDSLGIYLTYDPRPGRTDAERNCISNVRPRGLEPKLAAARLAWLVAAALSRRLTGVGLKDESDFSLAPGAAASPPPIGR